MTRKATSRPEPVKVGDVLAAGPSEVGNDFAAQLAAKNKRAADVRLTECSLDRAGERYKGCRLDSFEISHKAQEEVLEYLCKYADGLRANIKGGTNILLHGPPGTGKDHLLVAMVHEALALGIGVEWVDGADLYGAMRDRMGSDEAEQEFLRRYTSPDVLAISDPLPPMGAVTDFQRILLFRIIDRRYRDMRPTWMTLNVADREEAEKRLSPNICDRLGEGALRLTCNWPSYRDRKAASHDN